MSTVEPTSYSAEQAVALARSLGATPEEIDALADPEPGKVVTIPNRTAETVTWFRGKPVTEMTREELIDAVTTLGRAHKETVEAHRRSLDLMRRTLSVLRE